MIILHYALGFPPYRSGGLTKFCTDLMEQQAINGHTVALLWPGRMNIYGKEVAVKRHQNVLVRSRKVQSYEIVNPLPISYDEGIRNVDAFMMDTENDAYDLFLDAFHPDIIHIHTLMGLHKRFICEAKKRNIRLVFTAHDFFPICPKVTLFRNGSICKEALTCINCKSCNTTALNLRKIWLLQSPLYRILKDSILVKKMRQRHRAAFLEGTETNPMLPQTGDGADKYKTLRKYYYDLLDKMDVIHYNSSITKKVYETYGLLPKSRVINITHADIGDHRTIKVFWENTMRIRYLGSEGSAKGFDLLRNALDELWNINKNFCLDIHFNPLKKSPYMRVHDRYDYSDLQKIFDETDLLIAPSIWNETFGFTILEALSYGVPVVISGTVGAKDILEEGAGIIVEDITAHKLFNVLKEINASMLRKMNKVIVEEQKILQINEMEKEIEKECYIEKEL